MEINLATIENLPAIMDMLEICKQKMIKDGNDQWDGEYPDIQTLKSDVKNNSLYVILDEYTAVGMVVLNNDEALEYKDVKWKTQDKNPLVLHRLAVNPKYQGMGIAKKIISFAENLAYKNNYKSLRFDTYSKNKVAINLYKKCGYITSGKVYFNKKSLPYICFEKVFD